MSHLRPSQCRETPISSSSTSLQSDSLLAKPFSLDLSILGELFTRVKYRDVKTRKHSEFQQLYPVLLLLLLTLKASLAKPGKHPTSLIFAMKADMAVPRYRGLCIPHLRHASLVNVSMRYQSPE
ncbi:hypothetical protein ACEPAG_3182 [Sanghuangporus baumii]